MGFWNLLFAGKVLFQNRKMFADFANGADQRLAWSKLTRIANQFGLDVQNNEKDSQVWTGALCRFFLDKDGIGIYENTGAEKGSIDPGHFFLNICAYHLPVAIEAGSFRLYPDDEQTKAATEKVYSWMEAERKRKGIETAMIQYACKAGYLIYQAQGDNEGELVCGHD